VLALHKFPLTKPLADKFRENVSGSRDGRPDWVLTIGQGSGQGLFGPNSAVWQVHGTIATLVGGVRALLLQAAHPAPLSGVAEHSRYETDPLGSPSRHNALVNGHNLCSRRGNCSRSITR
jgi:uncharacterized protein (DUF2236 family)